MNNEIKYIYIKKSIRKLCEGVYGKAKYDGNFYYIENDMGKLGYYPKKDDEYELFDTLEELQEEYPELFI